MTDQPVALVACVKTKAPTARPARDLYRSPWFRLARAYVESRGYQWFVLSARHGLVSPDEVIAPYDESLLRMPRCSRAAWAEQMQQTMFVRRLTPAFGRRIILLAGSTYREDLEPWLAQQARTPSDVQVPMRGLGLGEQLSWLAANSASGPPLPPSPAMAVMSAVFASIDCLAA